MRLKSVQYLIDVIRGEEELIDPGRKVNRLAVGNKFIYESEDGINLVSKHLLSDKPFMICRLGSLELETVRQFFKFRNSKKHFTTLHRIAFSNTAGFFPTDDYNMTRFACEQIEVLKDADILACSYSKYELDTAEKFLSENAKIISYNSLTYPFLYSESWVKDLKGKKVLIINPFDETIREQYKKREMLYKDPNYLPEFKLITYKPVQGIGYSSKNLNYKTWFEALDTMKNDIKNIDFEVAIIGAGAYGMFLAQYCKSIGKQAVHMGGATQLLFGIRGKRWDVQFKDSYYNEHWTRPSGKETPDGVELFEGGTFAYW